MKNRFNQNHQLMLGCAYFFLVNGSAVLMTNALLVFLIRDYHLSYDQGGFLLTIQAAGNIVMSFLSGPISLRIGNKRTLLFSAIGFAASLLIIAIRPPLIMLQLALFLSGLAWGICNNPTFTV
ncbi:MAG: MFS transporter [Clostridia bacterium]|nr:MFS transporter [Clostridia bacterium]